MNKTINRDKSITGKIPDSEAGNYYVWKTLGDSRVRSRYAHRDDRIFHRDHPPEGGHPGEDYGCRCQAVPVPINALLPEEFQSDSKSLQYEDLFESGKVDKFNKMVEADNKREEVDEKLADEGSRLIVGKKRSPDRDADSYAPLTDPSEKKKGVYYVSRPIDQPVIGKFQSHNFIVYNADFLGDPDGQIISFGEKNNDNLGRVGEKTKSSSEGTHKRDVGFWHSRKVKRTQLAFQTMTWRLSILRMY